MGPSVQSDRGKREPHPIVAHRGVGGVGAQDRVSAEPLWALPGGGRGQGRVFISRMKLIAYTGEVRAPWVKCFHTHATCSYKVGVVPVAANSVQQPLLPQPGSKTVGCCQVRSVPLFLFVSFFF